ncbi:MAG: nucleotidyltransferase [Oligosphaeraceae bacterium]|nr:nucleotidyltransferase [Oligosphaeraceae bacterium]
MHSPSILVLAAGLGSRYGGIKQMDPVGPHGEFVLDYSVFDAWRAGFRKAVLVIREELEEPLREHFAGKMDGKMQVDYVCQRLDDLPAPFVCPSSRQKPWGTGHAIWSARHALKGRFAVINADDFYGAQSYQILSKFLSSSDCEQDTYAMVAYRLANTLSEHGAVSRGICRVDEQGFLQDVVERTSIEPTERGARYKDESGNWQPLTGEEPASLNLWGFADGLFAQMELLFKQFLKNHGQEEKSEFFIPSVVDSLIKAGQCRTKVLNTPEHWFGMTHASDREIVVERIAKLTAEGVYPQRLWS